MHLQPLSPAYSPWGLGVYPSRGMGQAEEWLTEQQLAEQQIDWGALSQAGQQGAQALASRSEGGQIASAAVATGGAIASAIAPSLAIPVIGPIVAGVLFAIYMFTRRKGPGQRIATTEIVNELEPELLKNVNGYLSGPRTVSSQRVALANFDAVWDLLVESCSAEEMGKPGEACVGDREAGACTWKADGKCWNWFVGYRDPIANDIPKPDSSVLEVAGSSVQQALASVLPSGSGSLLLLAGAGVLAFLAFSGGSKK